MSQKFLKSQSGQTLIETIVAIFILTMALTSGLGLSLYSLNSAQTSKNQIIASNLAREGIDVIRMMRDSNWLAAAMNGSCGGGGSPPCACPDIGNQPCYPEAFTGPTHDLDVDAPVTDNFWRIDFDSSTRDWQLTPRSGSYLICLQPATGLYQHANPSMGIICDSTAFARRIVISSRPGTSLNYSTSDPDNYEVIVQSVVQWSGKNCPFFDSTVIPTPSPAACKVVAEERLTNWKDYR